jgi:hypothetical protein
MRIRDSSFLCAVFGFSKVLSLSFKHDTLERGCLMFVFSRPEEAPNCRTVRPVLIIVGDSRTYRIHASLDDYRNILRVSSFAPYGARHFPLQLQGCNTGPLGYIPVPVGHCTPRLPSLA